MNKLKTFGVLLQAAYTVGWAHGYSDSSPNNPYSGPIMTAAYNAGFNKGKWCW